MGKRLQAVFLYDYKQYIVPIKRKKGKYQSKLSERLFVNHEVTRDITIPMLHVNFEIFELFY
ncbi:MAG TPA: hypothetical protein DDY16_02770 [Tenacibaculum sp.]|nr:hypothetical protein [Tenacibaculum sp.]HBI39857.1 hypothetical protein [Tenacibaculum sp.]